MYKKINVFSNNESNPFLDNAIEHLEKGNKTILMGNKSSDMLIDSDGEIKGHSVFVKRISIDKAEFRKLYVSNIAQFFDLSKKAMKVFSFIMINQKINQDDFYLHSDKIAEYTGYKARKTIISALSELIENKFIAKGKFNHHFYINPTIFWNGDRITFLRHYEKLDEGFLRDKQNSILLK